MACPLTFVKTMAVLEELQEGQVLEIKLQAGEPLRNISQSLKDEGHRVTGLYRAGEDACLLTVIKGGTEQCP